MAPEEWYGQGNGSVTDNKSNDCDDDDDATADYDNAKVVTRNCVQETGKIK